MTEKIELFYIDHPLISAPQLSEEVLSTFSQDQLEEYSALYDLYKTAQRKAAQTGHDLSKQCREMMQALFNNPADEYEVSKQVKYFDRMIRNGETAVDVHAAMYPEPSRVERLVQKAQERLGSIAKSRVTVGGEDTLQEINNAVTFLLDKGLSLNVDFTVSNAVSLATAHVQESIDTATVDDQKASLATYNVLLKGEPFGDVKDFALVRNSRYSSKDYTLENVSLTSEADDEEVNFSISFCHSSQPTLEMR